MPAIAGSLTVPIVPLILEGSGEPPTTLSNVRRKSRGVLDTLRYTSTADLIGRIREAIIEPAERKAEELRKL